LCPCMLRDSSISLNVMIFDECFKLCCTYFAVLSVIILFPSVLFLNIAVYRRVCEVECILCNSLYRITCAVNRNFIGQEFISHSLFSFLQVIDNWLFFPVLSQEIHLPFTW
jgi:hypothetical protein